MSNYSEINVTFHKICTFFLKLVKFSQILISPGNSGKFSHLHKTTNLKRLKPLIYLINCM